MPVQPAPPSDSGIGAGYVSAAGIAVVTVLILAALTLTIYCLVVVWPTGGSATAVTSSRLLGARLRLDGDQRLFTVVALAGFLGGLIHSARSLYWYVGNRSLRRSWLLMYVSLPFIGAALAVVFYIVLRGGLIAGQTTAAQLNAFGFAAVSVLVGLFSPEAAEKLKQIFSTLLTAAPGWARHRARRPGQRRRAAPGRRLRARLRPGGQHRPRQRPEPRRYHERHLPGRHRQSIGGVRHLGQCRGAG